MEGSLTRSRAWSIYHALRNAIPLHPSINLSGLNDVPSYLEYELSFVCLDKLSLLSLSHDGFHLVRLHILIQAPLA